MRNMLFDNCLSTKKTQEFAIKKIIDVQVTHATGLLMHAHPITDVGFNSKNIWKCGLTTTAHFSTLH